MLQRMCSILGLLAVLAATVVMPASPVVHAEPGAPWLSDAPTLPMAELGLDPDLFLYGQVGTTTVTLPVLTDMVPASLNVTAELPAYVQSAQVTVSQGDAILARADIPVQRGPVVIPLTGVQVVDNSVTLVLRSYLLPLQGYCLDPTSPLRLTDVGVSYTGLERAPATVADFLPPVLRKLVILLDRTPSHAEAGAAIQLATGVAARYGKQNPGIELAPLTGPATQSPGSGGPLERRIVISEGAEAGVSLLTDGGMPALLITGPASELGNQVRLLTSEIARYALTPNAVAGSLKPEAQQQNGQTTLRQLGQPGATATALSPKVNIALDQTQMGGPSHDLRVHLLGSFTPLPSTIGGQVVVSAGGETIARWPADASGTIDKTVDVPDRLLLRFTPLTVTVNIAGNTGQCGEFQPLTLTIDGASTVDSAPAEPPVPVGFQSLPQALMPRMLVGVNADIFGDTARAVQILTGLQRLSAVPLDTSVVPLDEAIESSDPAVLISPDGWTRNEVTLPVSAPDTSPMTLNTFDTAGNPATLTLDPALRFASLQAVFDGRRSVLVATSNGAPAQLDELLRWMGSDQRHWANAGGVALLSVAGRDPLTVTAADSMTPPEPVQQSLVAKWWWVGAIAAVVAVALIALLWSRARRRGGEA